jgi:uncharacterized protein DUF4124
MKGVVSPIVVALIAVAALLPAVASADIFQWTDDTGVTHYTNLKAEVPASDQASLQVVVDEAARQEQAAAPVAVQDASESAGSAAPGTDPPSQAQLVQALYDRSQWLTAYLEGLQSGLAAASHANSGGSVGINAPVVVTGSGTLPDFYGYNGPYGYGLPYAYGWPYFYPGVAVFHEGRFGHFGHFGRFGHFGHFGPLRKGPFTFGKMGGFGHAAPLGRAGWRR